MKNWFARAAVSVWLILVIALGLRLTYLRYELNSIPRQALEAVPFLYEPGDIAYSLATGSGFASPFRVQTGPTAWTTPIYPLLLAGVFEFFGTFTYSAFIAAVLLNILFSSLTCIPIFYAGKRIGGLALGATAAWLWAIFPNAVIIPFQWIWDTSLSGLLAAALLWTTLAVAEFPRWRAWILYGLLWGMSLMTNATLLAALPFMLGWMLFRQSAAQRAAFVSAHPTTPSAARAKSAFAPTVFRGAVALLATILCCVPWTIRNAVVFHAFIPLRSPLWLQLWLGNNDAYRDGFPGYLHPIDSIRERAEYVRVGEIAYMDEKKRQTLDWVKAHPARAMELVRQRFIATWLGTPHPWRDFLREPTLLVRVVFIANFLATLGAFAGLIRLAINSRLRAYFVPVAALPILFPFAFYLSQALLRYRYPIDPIVMLLCAIAVQGAFLARTDSAEPTAGALKKQ